MEQSSRLEDSGQKSQSDDSWFNYFLGGGQVGDDGDDGGGGGGEPSSEVTSSYDEVLALLGEMEVGKPGNFAEFKELDEAIGEPLELVIPPLELPPPLASLHDQHGDVADVADAADVAAPPVHCEERHRGDESEAAQTLSLCKLDDAAELRVEDYDTRSCVLLSDLASEGENAPK